jgi:hypothetical protein
MKTKMTRLFLMLLFMLLCLNGFSAIDSTNAMTGSWNEPAMWKDGTVPTAIDDVVIMPGTKITLTQNDSCKSLNMRGGTVGSTVSLNGFTLVVTGTLTTNVTTAADTNLLDVGDGYLICGSFIMGTGAGVAGSLHKLQIGSGTLEVLVNYNAGDNNDQGKRNILIGAGGSLFFSGTVGSGRSIYFLDPTSNIVYNSPNDQMMLGGLQMNNATYPNLTVSGGQKTLYAATSVNGVLTLDSAVISLNASTFTMNNGSTLVAGKPFGSKNMIETNGMASFIRSSNTIDGFKMIYPVGANGVYSPLVIDDLTATLAGGSQIRIRVVDQKHALVSDVDYINRFWIITTPAMTNINIGTAYFEYDNLDITNNESNIDTAAVFQLGEWNKILPGVVVNTSLNRIELATTGVINFAGQWTAANGSQFKNPEAGTKFTILDGLWGTASIWNDNTLPLTTDNVLILNDVQRNGVYTVNNLKVATGARLQTGDNNNSRRITVNGTFDVYGVYFDDRDGGIDTYVGKVTIHPTGNWVTTAVTTATNQLFQGGIENNGVFNITTANFSASQVLSGANLISFSGNVTIPADVQITNKGRVLFGGSAVLSGANASTSIWFNDTNSVLEYGSINAPMATGVFDVDQLNNTVVFFADGIHNIPNFNYYNLTIETRGTTSRVKTLSTGDYLILGNLTVNTTNTGSCTMRFNTTVTQSVVVQGNVVLTKSNTIIDVPTTVGNATGHTLTVNGVVSCEGQLNLHTNANNTFYADMTITSSGLIMSGTGTCRFRNLTLTGTGLKESTVSDIQLWWDGGTPKTATFSNVGGDFVQTAGNFTIKSWDALNNVTYIGLLGNGAITLNNLMFGGANNHVFTTILGTDIQVNGEIDFNTDNNAKFDLNGNTLTLNGDYKQATETCKMRGSTSSSLIINGTGNLTSSLMFDQATPGTTNVLGALQINRSLGEVILGNNVRIADILYLTDGNLKNGISLTMVDSSTISRSNGTISATPTLAGVVNVEYTAGLLAGAELPTTANKLYNLIINSGTDTVDFGAIQPTINNKLYYVSGVISVDAGNYLKMASDAKISLEDVLTSTVFPVGTNASTPLTLAVNSISGGLLEFEIKDGGHPNKNSLDYLNKYLTVSGSASAVDYDAVFNYLPANVVGSERNLLTSAWSGSAWTQSTPVDTINHTFSVSGIVSMGDFTAMGSPASTDSTLSGLTISSGTLVPGFDPTITSYVDTIGVDVASVTVTPTAAFAGASIKVNTVSVTSGNASGAIITSIGSTTITIEVLAENGISTQIYTIEVYRPASSDATLSNFTISDGVLVPAFDPAIVNYFDTVPYATTQLTVTPTTLHSGATITVNAVPVVSGNASSALNLNLGENTITIEVTAQDGITVKQYVVNVYRYDNVSISELVADEFSIYPIPARDVITISGSRLLGLEDVLVSILTIDGKVVVKKQLHMTDSEEFLLNVQALVPGKYILVLESGTSVIVKQILKY